MIRGADLDDEDFGEDDHDEWGTPIPTQCFALQTQWFCLESTHLFYLIDTVILLCRHSSFASETQ